MADKALKTSTFQWEGKDKRGNKLKGETNSTSIALVRAQLRSQGIAAEKVKKNPNHSLAAPARKSNLWTFAYSPGRWQP